MSKKIDMLNGSLWDKLLMFALPLAAGSILQQLFNAADVAVVGRFAGSDALAAVGATGAVINLLVNMFVGLSVGTNVVIATAIGRNDREQVGTAVHTSLLLALACGVFVMIAGITLAEPIMRAISTPREILALSVRYLRIYFAGVPFIMVYNFAAAILRSKGDTSRPLLALILSGAVNVLLNVFFVLALHMSVEGVAIATVLSNVLSSGLLIFFLTREKGEFRLRADGFRADGALLRRIAAIGIPTALQSTMFSVANVVIQSAVNGLGAAAVAGSAAAFNFDAIVYYLEAAFAQACVTFIGQNYGAGNRERCRQVTRQAWGLSLLTSTVLCVIFLLFRYPLAGIFSRDEEVIEFTVRRMIIILAFESLNDTVEIFSASLRGYGESMLPALMCVVGICAFRLVWIFTVFAKIPSFNTLLFAYPISWLLTSALLIGAYINRIRKMKTI